MPLPNLVLVHGGAHAGDCWNLTIDEIHRLEPDLRVMAIDLPGRRGKPDDSQTSAMPHGTETDTVGRWVDSAVRDIEFAGLGDVVIVGHSLAGLTVPSIVTRLGAQRVREMILAAAYVPPDGKSMVETFGGPVGVLARWRARSAKPEKFPRGVARMLFWHGMSSAQRKFASDKLCPESPRISVEAISRCGMPDVPRTWLLTLRDRALSVKHQRRCIAALGGVQTIVPIETGHLLMIAEPRRLAEILVERCRLYG